MEYRNLAGTDLELSVITFGAWAAGGWMWGSTDRREAVEAIRASIGAGASSIDTAPAYGQGESEEIVGEAITGVSRDKVQILTKYGIRWDLREGEFYFKSRNNRGEAIDIYKYAGKESVMQECENSLRRLKTDYIDLYQIHWPTPTPMEETFEAVSRLIEQGKVRYAGVCNYSAAEMEEAAKYISLASDQIPFSMVNREMDREVIPYCISQQKSVIVYSPMERGLLTGKMKPGQQFAEGDHRADNPFFSDESIRRTNRMLDRIRPIAEAKGATLGQMVLRWTLNHPGVTIALVGARNAAQALQNVKAGEMELTAEEMRVIDEAVGNF